MVLLPEVVSPEKLTGVINEGGRLLVAPLRLNAVATGIDLFDCVMPTRNGRNATCFTDKGYVKLRNAVHRHDPGPIEEGCTCPACAEFSRGYIRHLIKAEEILGLRLISLHNLHFYLNLMTQVREAIEAGRFAEFRKGFVSNYKTLDESAV